MSAFVGGAVASGAPVERAELTVDVAYSAAYLSWRLGVGHPTNPERATVAVEKLRDGGVPMRIFEPITTWRSRRPHWPQRGGGCSIWTGTPTHGDGVEALTADNPDVMTASIHNVPLFPGTGYDDDPDRQVWNYSLEGAAVQLRALCLGRDEGGAVRRPLLRRAVLVGGAGGYPQLTHTPVIWAAVLLALRDGLASAEASLG